MVEVVLASNTGCTRKGCVAAGKSLSSGRGVATGGRGRACGERGGAETSSQF